jgi:hypothetical protein
VTAVITGQRLGACSALSNLVTRNTQRLHNHFIRLIFWSNTEIPANHSRGDLFRFNVRLASRFSAGPRDIIMAHSKVISLTTRTSSTTSMPPNRGSLHISRLITSSSTLCPSLQPRSMQWQLEDHRKRTLQRAIEYGGIASLMSCASTFNLPHEDFASCDPVKWWTVRQAQFPNLWRLARDLMSIPGACLRSQPRSDVHRIAQALLSLSSASSPAGATQSPFGMHVSSQRPSALSCSSSSASGLLVRPYLRSLGSYRAHVLFLLKKYLPCPVRSRNGPSRNRCRTVRGSDLSLDGRQLDGRCR